MTAANAHAGTTILDACRRIIRPLARVLLRYGVGYREFAEVCKECFVEVAAEDFGIRGRPTNISRISVATGVSRKETRRIRSDMDQRKDSERFGMSPASIVLRGWYSDPDFVSSSGAPLALCVGDGNPALSELVSRYAGDVTAGAVLAEFARLGLIERVGRGKIRPLSPIFMPPNVDGQLFAAGVQSLSYLLSTISYNTNPSHAGAPLFERYAWSTRLPEATRPIAHRLVRERGGDLISFFDRWLREHEVAERSTSDAHQGEVGIGIYYFDASKS